MLVRISRIFLEICHFIFETRPSADSTVVNTLYCRFTINLYWLCLAEGLWLKYCSSGVIVSMFDVAKVMYRYISELSP